MKKYSLIIILGILLGYEGFCQNTELPKKIRVTKLSNAINSNAEELGPILSGDGQTLYFIRYSNAETLQDIYMSKKDKNGAWQKATKLPEPVNNKQHNVVCGTNYDGSVLYLSNAYDSKKTKNRYEGMTPGISVSFREGDDWSYPITIQLSGLDEQYLSKSSHFYYHVHDGGKHVLISFHDTGNKTSSVGEEDIYYCTLEGAEVGEEYKKLFQDDNTTISDAQFKGLVQKYASSLTYKVIKSLGQEGNINTESYETAPLLSKDRKTLYFTRHDPTSHKKAQEDTSAFSSNTHIYKITRKDAENWDTWDKPEKLYEDLDPTEDSEGNLNDTNFDAYLTFEEMKAPEIRENKDEIVLERGYFASSRKGTTGSKGDDLKGVKADIYQFEIVQPIPFNADLIVNVLDCERNTVNLLEIDSLSVTLEILDEEKKPLEYKIENGQAKIKIKKAGKYTITARTGSESYTSDQRSSNSTSFLRSEKGSIKRDTLCLINTRIAVPKGVFYFAFDRYKEFFIKPIPASEEDSIRLIKEFGLDLGSNKYAAGTANITDYEAQKGVFYAKGAAKSEYKQDYEQFFQLVSDLEASKAKYQYIFISGFADIIGLDKNNLILSENRALTLAKEIYKRLAKGKTEEEKKQLKKQIIIDSQGSANHSTSGADTITWKDRAKSRRVTVLTLDDDLVQTTDGSTPKVSDKTKFKSLDDYNIPQL